MELKQSISRRQLMQLGLLTGTVALADDLLGKVGMAHAQAARAARFETIAEGFVDKRDPKGPMPLASLSRVVVTKQGDLVCTYVINSKAASNDTVPMITRSRDGGLTWERSTVIWPHLRGKVDIYGSVSRSPDGELYIYGGITPMGKPGDTVHQPKNQGMKENQIFWAKSPDSGRTWTEPTCIPLPIPGAAEAAGPMCITRRGRWLVCYAPHNTFDLNLVVDRNQVVVMWSDDQGKSWRHSSMIRLPEIDFGTGEAWVIELVDGRLLGTTCHNNFQKGGKDFTNKYALSLDGGTTWEPTQDTGILGESTALAPQSDGQAMFVYNRRRHGEVGVWLARVKPTPASFGIQANQPVWRAEKIAQGEYSNWERFTFGEPSVTLLPDGAIFVTLWCAQPSGQGIRYVKLKMVG